MSEANFQSQRDYFHDLGHLQQCSWAFDCILPVLSLINVGSEKDIPNEIVQ